MELTSVTSEFITKNALLKFMWGYCDPEEKSDNEKQDSASRKWPLKQNIHQSIFLYLSIQATVKDKGTVCVFQATMAFLFPSTESALKLNGH